MNFIKTSYISAFTNAIVILVKLVVNKAAAIIGPANFAIYGQFKDFLGLITTISQLGVENGIIKYTSQYQDDLESYKKLLGTALFLHIAGSILSGLTVLILKNYINTLLFEHKDYSYLLVITTLSIIFLALYNLALNILNGLKQIKVYTIISLIATVISGGVSIYMVRLYGLNGLVIGIAINNLIFFILSLIAIKKYGLISISLIHLKPDKAIIKKLVGFSSMSLSGILSMSLSLLFLRTLIINDIGDFEAGIWDSLWRMSTIYYTFLISSFKFYILPTFTTLEGSAIRKELFKVWKIILPTILAVTVSIYLFKGFIIVTLFSKEFLLINSIIIYQLFGDIIRIHGWVIGNILIAKAKTKIFVTLQIVWGLTFCLSTYICINLYGLIGATMGYFITCTLHFIWLNLSERKLIWKRF
ncbi:LPS biosynthesis protein [Neptunitalea chrysea]|uniref:LPS biosynthesis protein n=1 Tax=Neptunitalea chrysea TaxID=1647581 RepID=A0A9W6EUN7_9FLAO|nr:O-antigen translocase [Neptunitalea chrysea]GLB53735.1 LPS biosynthesis protein [Neptunitalea chrysea]